MPGFDELQDIFRHGRNPGVLYVCKSTPAPTLASCADTGARRRVATFPRDWNRESSIHPTWSACASRRQSSGSRFQSIRATSVPLSARRVMPTTKPDYGAGGGRHANTIRDGARFFFFISPLPFHVYADPPRVRRCHPALCHLICSCAPVCFCTYSCTAPLPCTVPEPSRCYQRARADGTRALGPHGCALSKHPQ